MGIGGNAALAAGFAAGLVSLDLAAAAPAPPPKGFGALVDSGGKAALAGDLVAGAGDALAAENGFLGGAALIGGNALLEGVAFVAGGTGAFEEVEAEKGVGALVARGGKLALGFFSSFFSELSDDILVST